MQAYEELYERSKADPEKFWGELAQQELHWFQPFSKVLEWNEPFAKWFVGGRTNVSYNCLDAHLTTARLPISSARSESPRTLLLHLPNNWGLSNETH